MSAGAGWSRVGLLNGSLVEKTYRWAESAGEHKRNACLVGEGGVLVMVEGRRGIPLGHTISA